LIHQDATAYGSLKTEMFRAGSSLGFTKFLGQTDPDWAANSQSIWVPSGVSANLIYSHGSGALGTSGTFSQPALSVTDFAQSQLRTNLQTNATNAAVSEARDNIATYWGGNAAGRGGYQHYFRVAVGLTPDTGTQITVGTSSNTAVINGNATALPNFIGLCKLQGSSNWQFATRNGNAVATQTDLGLAVAAGQTLDLMLTALPGAGPMFAQVRSLDFSSQTTLFNSQITANAPNPATLNGRRIGVRTNVALAQSVQMVRVYSRKFN
jgi:hypothetical protein